ncbi:unnamed protein product [Adineta steineri]|uniref:Uncharacterized protein n=1 Tax=Adineta steineri TaxID=433720 RepID=A0A815FH62_9BILA|nr:unnamed protein product [Adineta steineri]
MNNGQYRSIVQPYLSLPNNSDEYTQKLYASLSEIKEKLNTDEIQMIFVAHRYEQTGRIPWDIMSKKEKFLFLLNIIIRILTFILSLYIFIITLDLMTSAFTLLSRSAFGQIFKSRIFLKNPIISLMIGIIITTILQSSSTVTSIIVSMVGSGIVTDIRSVIPMIMGTSITNTLVAFSQIGNRNEFSRSFSSGVLMDVFNYLTTLILLPMEILIDRITPSSDIFHRGGYLARVSGAIAITISEKERINIQLLKSLTKPLTKLIIQIDENVLLSGGYLARVSGAIAITISEKERINIQLLKSLTKPLTKLIIQIDENVLLSNETNQTIGKIYCTPHLIKCKYLFRSMIEKFNDYTVGIILFICSLIILTGILLLMVKLLKSLIIGVIDDTLKRILHIQSYGWKEYLLGYVFIIIGIFGAVLVQSSSVFCSILTPLVGLQVLSLERNYELTIGANIGTTITAFLASLTQTGLFFRQSIQIALIHFLFNLSGCILWYIFPYFRRIPIYLSYQIGHIVSKYRWFALLYLMINFFLFPLIILFLALIHWLVAILFLLCLFLLIIFISIINYFQKTNPNKLPSILQSWSFLPRSLRSFSYWDHRLEIFLKLICCQRYFKLIYPSDTIDKPLKEQYVSMKDQYLIALDHRYLVHTHQLNQLFEKHYAPMITNYVQELYRSITGKPTQGQRALSNLIQMNSTNIHHEEEELIDRIILFDRDKKKEILVNEQKKRINIQLLKSLTKPLTKLIIQIDENVLLSNETNQTIGKIYCTPQLIKCKYLFRSMIEKFNDYTVGIILFICSLIILTGILLFMVKLLKSLIIGVIDDTLKKILHIQSYGWKEYLLGYVFIIIGISGAVLVQSSSVYCSILTPLVGLKVLSLERNYELTIGANIGTTITAFLASLTQTGLFFRQSIQIALIHFLFNLSGCILWYIFPYFRRIPIYLSYQIGHIVSKYRWFALLYLIINFFLFPIIILFLALIHWLVAILFLLCLFLLIIFILIINYFQKANPNKLPSILQSWSFLPRSLRSFSYWDHRLEIFLKLICCQRYVKLIYPSENTDKPLKEQYVSMKDQYLLALDHRYLVHTHQLNQLFEKHYAPMITNYVQEFYRSLTGKPTQGQRALSNLIQMNSTNIHHEEEEELIDRIVLFDRDKKKEILVNEQKSSLSF